MSNQSQGATSVSNQTPSRTTVRTKSESKVNILPMRDMYRLMTWLDMHRDRIINTELNTEGVAETAQKELKFRVTPCNIKSACRELQPPITIKGGKDRVTSRAKLKAAEEKLANALDVIKNLESQMAAVRQQIEDNNQRVKSLHSFMVNVGSRLRQVEKETLSQEQLAILPKTLPEIVA